MAMRWPRAGQLLATQSQRNGHALRQARRCNAHARATQGQHEMPMQCQMQVNAVAAEHPCNARATRNADAHTRRTTWPRSVRALPAICPRNARTMSASSLSNVHSTRAHRTRPLHAGHATRAINARKARAGVRKVHTSCKTWRATGLRSTPAVSSIVKRDCETARARLCVTFQRNMRIPSSRLEAGSPSPTIRSPLPNELLQTT